MGRNKVQSLRAPLVVVVSAVAFAAATGNAIAQTSEIDSYDRAVTSQSKENALAFLKEFRSSHLVGDLIDSLHPDVAREVCANLPSGVSSARRACAHLREARVAKTGVSSSNDAGAAPPLSASAPATQPPLASASSGTGVNVGAVDMSAAGVPTQSFEAQPTAAVAPPPAAVAMTSRAAPSELIEPAAVGQDGSPGASAQIGAVTPTQTAAALAGFRIQLLSTKSRAEAESTWQDLQMAYPDLLRDLQFSILEVDLGATEGGVVYRGVAGPLPSRDEAKVLCIVIRSSPPYSDCFVAGY